MAKKGDDKQRLFFPKSGQGQKKKKKRLYDRCVVKNEEKK